MSLLKRVREALAESKVDLPARHMNMLQTAHTYLSHALKPDTRAPDYNMGSGYSSHVLSGFSPGYVAAVHGAIGEVLGKGSAHKPGHKGGPVNWSKPTHKLGLLQASNDILRTLHAKDGSPFKFGSSDHHRFESNDDLDNHLEDHLNDVNRGLKSVKNSTLKDTFDKLGRRS